MITFSMKPFVKTLATLPFIVASLGHTEPKFESATATYSASSSNQKDAAKKRNLRDEKTDAQNLSLVTRFSLSDALYSETSLLASESDNEDVGYNSYKSTHDQSSKTLSTFLGWQNQEDGHLAYGFGLSESNSTFRSPYHKSTHNSRSQYHLLLGEIYFTNVSLGGAYSHFIDMTAKNRFQKSKDDANDTQGVFARLYPTENIRLHWQRTCFNCYDRSGQAFTTQALITSRMLKGAIDAGIEYTKHEKPFYPQGYNRGIFITARPLSYTDKIAFGAEYLRNDYEEKVTLSISLSTQALGNSLKHQDRSQGINSTFSR